MPQAMADFLTPADQAQWRLDEVDQHLVSLLDPASFEAEQYRAVRHVLQRVHAARKVIAVTSAVDGDGKTTTAINLAGAFAHAREARVLVADLDLRSPMVGNRLGLATQSPGLVDAILDAGLGLDDVVRRCARFNVSVLPTGRTPAVPYELLKSPRLGELLEETRRHYDYIILDTPPLVPVPDSRLIGEWADGILMVVACHRTPRKLVEEALNLVEPAKLVGVVFNGDERPLSASYGYYYTYRRASGRRAGWWAPMVERIRRALGGP